MNRQEHIPSHLCKMMVWKRWLLLNMAIYGIFFKNLGGFMVFTLYNPPKKLRSFASPILNHSLSWITRVPLERQLYEQRALALGYHSPGGHFYFGEHQGFPPKTKHFHRKPRISTKNQGFPPKSQLMVNCWFGAGWFGIRTGVHPRIPIPFIRGFQESKSPTQTNN